ncbi:MAG: hypothetical protein Q7V31_11985 [Parvibaculum sp.]|uniref:hypothetical protein n=1 Tax=Parvibaculum sp. TaxID=2024848 RepID=UPI00271A6312|nr:hypothetical protein [Parvibaculum sp.]MDO8839638.1 hypothetical protein [Parvibaculum sp.]
MAKASMSRAHFVLIARTIAALPDNARSEAAEAFADALASTNPEFKRERFLTACDAKA